MGLAVSDAEKEIVIALFEWIDSFGAGSTNVQISDDNVSEEEFHEILDVVGVVLVGP